MVVFATKIIEISYDRSSPIIWQRFDYADIYRNLSFE